MPDHKMTPQPSEADEQQTKPSPQSKEQKKAPVAAPEPAPPGTDPWHDGP